MHRGFSRRIAIGLLSGCLATTGLACGTLSVPQERALGDEFERQVKSQVTFLHDRVVSGYISKLGDRIVEASGPQPFRYRFFVIEDDEINAFAGPAGNIYIHTETILKARNVSELAGVMAHEVGHVVKRHIAHNYNRQRATGYVHQAGVIAAGILAGGNAAKAADLGGGLAGAAYLNSFGREAEHEADAFAVTVVPRIGIDPTGIVTFFQTLAYENQGGQVPTFLSSHPTTEERIASTRALIDAQVHTETLKIHDNGRLEIIQQRIRLLLR